MLAVSRGGVLQLVSGLQDLLGGHVVAGVVAGHQLGQSRTAAELDSALIVHDHATDGHGVAHTNLGHICSTGLDAVAVQIGAVGQIHVEGHVAVGSIVGGCNSGNLTGQICVVAQALAVSQGSCIRQDICLVGGFRLRHATAGLAAGQSTATAVLQLALVVLQNTANGDGIAQSDACNAGSTVLQTVADNGLILITADLNGNGDVAIVLVIRGVDLNDLTGQAGVVIQMLTIRQCSCIGHNGCSIGGLGLCYAAAAQTVQQSTAAAELQLALVVLNDTLDGDNIATGNIGNTVALQTVADDGHGSIAVHRDHNGNVAVSAVIGGFNIGNLTGEGCVVVQVLTPAQLGCVAHDLGRVAGGLLSHTAAADTIQHLTAGVELDLALVVLDDTLYGNDIIHSQLIAAGTLQTVAGDGLTLCTLDDHDQGDVAVVGIIGSLNGGDLTGQSGYVRQSLAILQCIGSCHDLQGIGGSLHSVTLLPAFQDTAIIELNLAVVVLNGAGDGNDVANIQLVNAFALQTVAGDGILIEAFHHHGNGDVLELCIVHGVNADDLTGERYLIGQALTVCQSIGLFQHLLHVDCLGQNAVPGVGNAVAALIGDGGNQLIGGVLLASLVHVDGDHFTFAGNDLNLAVAAFNGPYHVERLAAHADHAIALVIPGGLNGFCGALVQSLQVFHCRIGGNVITHGGVCFYFCTLTAGKTANHQGKQKHPCKNSFHSKLLILFSLTQ